MAHSALLLHAAACMPLPRTHVPPLLCCMGAYPWPPRLQVLPARACIAPSVLPLTCSLSPALSHLRRFAAALLPMLGHGCACLRAEARSQRCTLPPTASVTSHRVSSISCSSAASMSIRMCSRGQRSLVLQCLLLGRACIWMSSCMPPASWRAPNLGGTSNIIGSF